MLFGYIRGVAGDVTSPWVDRNVVPYYDPATARLAVAGGGRA